MNRIVQILGPTGIGKSQIAVQLSGRLKGEVISADSVQVYRGFDIGSSKIRNDEMSGIPHHLIDVLDPSEQFNVNRFLELSLKAVNEIEGRGNLPVVCGGTALYLRAMVKGIFEENKERRVSRERLKQIEESYGAGYLWRRLKKIDIKYAEKIGENDKNRIIRGLEIYYNNGIIPSKISMITSSPFSGYRFVRVGLQLPRELMYERINIRVDQMVEEGLMEEVAMLRNKFGDKCPPMSAIGYREMNQVLDKKIDLETGIKLIKQHSRNFAKRQMTWFNGEKDIVWFHPKNEDGIFDFVKKELNEQA